MTKTNLLPPLKAVQITWARTGAFSEAFHSQQYAEDANKELKDIKNRAKNNKNEEEYVSNAIALIEANLRNLDNIYKLRNLNFEDNQKLRSTHLDYVKQSLDFGIKTKDFLKSIPSIALGGAGGITLAQIIGASSVQLWIAGLFFAGLGYLINWIIIKNMRVEKQWLYIQQDYERSLYFEEYLNKAYIILKNLYNDVYQEHENIFKNKYPTNESSNELIKNFLKGIQPTFCKHIKKHLKNNNVEDRKGNPITGRKLKKLICEQWTYCETGNLEGTKNCPLWRD